MLIDTMTRQPTILPLATITKAEAVDDGWVVTDAQGEDHRVDSTAWNLAVQGTPSALIPALPGTYLINANTDGDEPRVWKNNVLGWMVCADTEVRPMLLDMSMLNKTWDVLHPDGRVERSSGDCWETLDQYLLSEGSAQQAAE